MNIYSYNSNIPFCAYKCPFSEHLESVLKAVPNRKDEIILTMDFKDVFQKTYNKKNHMGCGSFNHVYKIDDYYVMRIGKKESFQSFDFRRPTKAESAWSKLKTYYGSIVAKFGNIEILKNAVGDNKAISGLILRDAGTKKLNHYVSEYLPTFAKLPQSAYNDLFADLKRLAQARNLGIDYLNPENIIAVDNQIRVVDEIQGFRTQPMGLCLTLVDDVLHIPEACLRKEDIDNLRLIMKKVLVAVKKHDIPWELNSWDIEVDEVLKCLKIPNSINEIYDSVKDLKTEAQIEKALSKYFSV